MNKNEMMVFIIMFITMVVFGAAIIAIDADKEMKLMEEGYEQVVEDGHKVWKKVDEEK